jgi:hypothetical protein
MVAVVVMIERESRRISENSRRVQTFDALSESGKKQN